MVLTIAQTNTYDILEVSIASQAVALLTDSTGTLADVPGTSISSGDCVNGDICLVSGSFSLSADSGSVSEGVVTVVDNGTSSDLAITLRRTDNTAPGLLFSYAFTAKYLIQHAPSSGPPGTTTFKFRGRRSSGGGNAYFRSPCSLIVQLSRGLT